MFQARKIKGELAFDAERFLNYLQTLKDGNYWIEIKRVSAKRSLQQNNYYWFCLRIISETSGHTPEELHEIYKRMFLLPQFIKYRGKELKMPNTTTKLNKGEFFEYMERISAEAADMGISLPEAKSFNPY